MAETGHGGRPGVLASKVPQVTAPWVQPGPGCTPPPTPPRDPSPSGNPPVGPRGSPLSSWLAASEYPEGGGREAAATGLREPRCVSGRQGLGWVPGVVTGRGRKTTRRRSPSYHTGAGRRGHPGRRGAARASPRGRLDPAGPGRPVWGLGTRGGAAPGGPSRRCAPCPVALGDPRDHPVCFPTL